MKHTPISSRPPQREVYRLEIISIGGEELRYSDQGLVVAFPDPSVSASSPTHWGNDHHDGEGFLRVHFSLTQYQIIKQLIFHLNEVVPFAGLISTYQLNCHPQMDRARLEQGSIRLLSKHIYSTKKKLPTGVHIRCEYNVGYCLMLVRSAVPTSRKQDL